MGTYQATQGTKHISQAFKINAIARDIENVLRIPVMSIPELEHLTVKLFQLRKPVNYLRKKVQERSKSSPIAKCKMGQT